MSTCEGENKERFDKFLEENRIAIMSTIGCPACVDAKNLLKNSKINYAELDLTEKENDGLFNCLYNITKSHYVPQIFINKKYIGGFRELTYLDKTGLLRDLI